MMQKTRSQGGYLMKTIALLILGYDSAPVEMDITPDVTALNILTQAGLEDCSLIRTSEPQIFFSREEVIYDEVNDGEALYAVLPTGV
jgi:hypothetical protein